jgi:hypothetical protein
MAIGEYQKDKLLDLQGNLYGYVTEGGPEGGTGNGVFHEISSIVGIKQSGTSGMYTTMGFAFSNATDRVGEETSPASISSYLCIKY